MRVAVATCQVCHKLFAPRRSTARYCSGKCRVAAHRASSVCNATTASTSGARASKSAAGISATPRLSGTEKLPSGIIADAIYPGMYRIRLPGGGLSDIVNLTRANDALAGNGASDSRHPALDQASGKFPRPIPLGERAVGWLEAEIDLLD